MQRKGISAYLSEDRSKLIDLVNNAQMTKHFWNQHKANKPVAKSGNEIVIYDFIDDYALNNVRAALAKAKGPVTVKINSWGGDVFAGFAIYNELEEYKGAVTTKVMGMAASAAALIFMAGEKRYMKKTSMLMFHKSWNLAIGNADDLRSQADILDKIDALQASVMENRMEGIDDYNAFLLKEEFMTLKDAKGFKAAEEDPTEEPKGEEDDDKPEGEASPSDGADDTGKIDEDKPAGEASPTDGADDTGKIDEDKPAGETEDDDKPEGEASPTDGADDTNKVKEDGPAAEALKRKKMFIQNEISALMSTKRYRKI